jgi:tRNA_anti-like
MPRDYDDDDDRPRRRRTRDNNDDYDDRPRRRSRRDDDYERAPAAPAKQVSILGIFSLVKGIGALIASFMPCIGAVAILPGLLGLLLGIIGLVVARKSKGRQGTGLPTTGICISSAAIVIALIQIGIMGVFSGGAAARREAEAMEVQSATNVATVTAVQIDREFETNELKAESDYKGKVLEVSGTIKSIVRDRPGVIVVELNGTPQSTVDCEFRRDAESQLAGRNIGEQITIRGKCKGRVQGWVTLVSCTVTATGGPPAGANNEKAAPEVKGPDGGNVPQLTAAQFAKEFVDDEDRANEKYQDKVIEITGPVSETYLDDCSVHLRAAPGVNGAVRCEFARTADNRAKLRQLRAGQTVRIRGTCAGGTNLEACVIVK